MKLPKSISSLFSSKVEESVPLRLLALVALWTVALSLAWVGGSTWTWVGGSTWTWLGGGIAATTGHAFSYHRRHRGLGRWPAVMALMVVGLALFMRSEILAALNGNWLPLAHYLLLVQAISSFDVRTRGGLYAGFALSGIVLFFASQQAFDLSFGIFLLGYAGLLMGFLARATLEDASRNATPSPASTRRSQLGFWSVTAVAVLMFSVAAFLLLPRGESNATGYQQVSALPITAGADLSPDQGAGGGPSDTGPTEAAPGEGQTPAGNEAGPDSGTAGGQEMQDQLAGPGSFSTAEGEGVVMRVRSPVASYWRGQVYDRFDGSTWQPDTGREGHRDPGGCPRGPGVTLRPSLWRVASQGPPSWDTGV